MSNQDRKSTGCAFDTCIILGIIFGPILLANLLSRFLDISVGDYLTPFFEFLIGVMGAIISGYMASFVCLSVAMPILDRTRFPRMSREQQDKIYKKIMLYSGGICTVLFMWCIYAPSLPSQGNETRHTDDATDCSVTTAEKRYWITSSSRKTHNSSCRYYANSKGHYSSEGTGNNCRICGGAIEEEGTE